VVRHRFIPCLWLAVYTGLIMIGGVQARPIKQVIKTERHLGMSPLFQAIKSIQKKGVLRVGMIREDTNYLRQKMPDGTVQGLDVTIAQWLANALHVKLVINGTFQSYEDVVDGVAQDKIDLGISGLSLTPARTLKVIYATTPYLVLKVAGIVNRNHLAQNAAPSLRMFLNNARTTIATIARSSYEAFSRKNFPKARFLSVKNWTEACQAVHTGKATAAFSDNLSVGNLFHTNIRSNLFVMPIALPESDPNYVICKPDLWPLGPWIEHILTYHQTVNLTYNQLREATLKKSEDETSRI
jgi:ABC-type amino acid transport substrate-binding protein